MVIKCPRCNGRKYIELDKIGLRVTGCPDCKGTGEVNDTGNGTERNNQLPIGELPKWGDMINDDIEVLENIPMDFAQKSRGKPVALILSERMGTGESLEELADKARAIIESQQGGLVSDPELGIVDRIESNDSLAGSTDTGQSSRPPKRKARKKARARIS